MQRVTLVTVLGTLLFITPPLGKASQDQRTAFADVRLYTAVLDLLFDYERTPDYGPMVVLRYTHNHRDATEMQLSFARSQSGTVYRVERWSVPRGAPSIWEQLGKLAESDRSLTQASALKSLTVNHGSGMVAASSRYGRLLQRMSSLRIPLSGSDMLVLDDTHYSIAVESLNREVRLRIRGLPAGDEEMAPIVQWMNEVRREFDGIDLSAIGR